MERVCKELGINVYRETSAKKGEGITELFEQIATTPVPKYNVTGKKGFGEVIQEDPKGESAVDASAKDNIFRLSSAMPQSSNAISLGQSGATPAAAEDSKQKKGECCLNQ